MDRDIMQLEKAEREVTWDTGQEEFEIYIGTCWMWGAHELCLVGKLGKSFIRGCGAQEKGSCWRNKTGLVLIQEKFKIMRLDEITKAGNPEREKEMFIQHFESTDVCVY